MSLKCQRLPLGLADWFVGLKRYSEFAPNCCKNKLSVKTTLPNYIRFPGYELKAFQKEGSAKNN